MTNIMDGRFADAIVTTAGACMVVVGMAALDERVRMYLASVLTSDPLNELVRVSVRAQRVAGIAMETVDAHGIEPMALAVLAVASAVLAALMVRT